MGSSDQSGEESTHCTKRLKTMNDQNALLSSADPTSLTTASRDPQSNQATIPQNPREKVTKVHGGTQKPPAKPYHHPPTCCNNEAMCKKYGPPIQLQPAHYARLLYANPVCILTSCDPASFIPKDTLCCEAHSKLHSASGSRDTTDDASEDLVTDAATSTTVSSVLSTTVGEGIVGEAIPVQHLIHEVVHGEMNEEKSHSIASLTQYNRDSLYNINHRRVNVMTISWLTPTTNAQGGIVLSLHADRYSAALVLKNKRFVLNIPVRGMESMVRNIGANTGRAYHQENLEGLFSEGGIRDLERHGGVKEANDTCVCSGEGVTGNKPDLQRKTESDKEEKSDPTCPLKLSRPSSGKKGVNAPVSVTSPSGYEITPTNKFALLGLKTCRPGWRTGPDYSQPLLDQDGQYHGKMDGCSHLSADSDPDVKKQGKKGQDNQKKQTNKGKDGESMPLQQKATLISDLHGDIGVSDCVAHLVCTVAHVLPPLELQTPAQTTQITEHDHESSSAGMFSPSHQSVVNVSRSGTPIMGMGTASHLTLFCTIETAWVRKGYWANGTFAPTKPEFPPYLTFFGGGIFGYCCSETQMQAVEEKFPSS